MHNAIRFVVGGEISFFVEGTIENTLNGASASITFVSGENTGKKFTAVYNPDFSKETSNVIRLPEGVTASLGDMYTIDNPH